MARRKTSVGPVSPESPKAEPAKRRGRPKKTENETKAETALVEAGAGDTPKKKRRKDSAKVAGVSKNSIIDDADPISGKKRKRGGSSHDWEMIESQYRAGILSLRAIGDQHGISQTAVHKKAKAEGWQRNLSDKVRTAAKEKLVREDGLHETGLHGGLRSSTNDKETIEVAAQALVAVAREHRATIRSGRSIICSLLTELQEVADNREEIEAAIEEETAGDRDSKRRNMMMKAVALPSRAGVMLNLSAALKNVIGLERQAFNMDDTHSVASGDVPEGTAAFRIEFVKASVGSHQYSTSGGF